MKQFDADANNVSTAPEVPQHIARKYGLHHDGQAAPASTAETDSAQTDIPVVPAEKPGLDDDPNTDAAVDDIVSKESDQLLAAQDSSSGKPPVERSFSQRFRHFFRAWWRNKTARYSTIAVVLIGLVATACIPASRYAVLNTFGVRSSASIIVRDSSTELPLKNVSIQLGGTTVSTDRQGKASFKNLKLGGYRLQVKRIAFAPQTQQVTIGWGSNPLGKVDLRAVGTRYTILVKDYLSGKPIVGAEAESDQGNALSDDTGKITLTIDDTSVTSLAVTLNAPSYRSEALQLDAVTKSTVEAILVPSQQVVFISKESGKYDVYSSDIDGKNKKIVLAASGLENNTLSLVMSPDKTQAALVSTRNNVRDKDGYLLNSLTFISLAQGTSTTVDQAAHIQLIDWIGNRLIYRATIAGASGANPARNRIVAYNYASNSRIQLAAANQFNMTLSAEGYIYYAASSTDPQATLGLVRIKPDSSQRERLSDQEVWTGLRTDQRSLRLQTPDGWYAYELNSKNLQKTNPPTVFANYFFVANPKGDRQAWVEPLGGKGTVLVKENAASTATALTTQSGITYPMYWLSDDVIIYRVVTAGESADYAVSARGGSPRKISDVTPSYGFTQAQ